MVKLTKIYTRGGDKGETSLGDGSRTQKHALRVAACGDVDETNAAIGLARLHSEGEADAMLSRIQNDLFDLGADLCRPGKKGQGEEDEQDDKGLRIIESQVVRLESEIDTMNDRLETLTSFILPGGTAAAAHLHVARTVARRAERLVSELATIETVNRAAFRYLNRLSDHLFQLARLLNDGGRQDVLWIPGAHR